MLKTQRCTQGVQIIFIRARMLSSNSSRRNKSIKIMAGPLLYSTQQCSKQ